MNTLSRISTLIDSGFESPISALADRLEAKSTLPDALRTKLDGLGLTPIDEPKIYEAIQSDDVITIALALLSEDEIKEYEATQIGALVHAVVTRIEDYKTEDGIFKSTPNTEDCKIPNFLEADKLRKLFIKQNDAITKWNQAPDGKEKDKATKAVTTVSTELDTLIMGISGLDATKLTDWEKALVITQVAGAANNAFLSAQGKPFAI